MLFDQFDQRQKCSIFTFLEYILFSLQKLARAGARCDFGVFVGASKNNYATLPAIGGQAAALKMYLNETFTTLKLDDISVWMKVGFTTFYGLLTFFAQTIMLFTQHFSNQQVIYGSNDQIYL